MEVLVYIPFTKITRHLGTALEIIENHILNGDRVTAVTCNGSILSCFPNIFHDYISCKDCICKKNLGLSLLSEQIDEIPIINLTNSDRILLNNFNPEFDNIQELRKLTIGNFDIGMGVLSTLISATLDPHPRISEFKNIILRLLYSSYAVYISNVKILENNKFDKVYIFNGRFSIYRPILRICEHFGIEYDTFELGSTIKKYQLFNNTLPHDTEYFQNKIIEEWNDCKDVEYKNQIANRFYQDRSNGINYSWYSFTNNQITGKLPSKWDKHKTNIVIYTSSEHEFKAINEKWNLPFYEDQTDGIYKIYESIKDFKDSYHIYVRLHPPASNMTKGEKSKDDYSSLDSDIITIIESNSTISSYSLLHNADKIITFGSTMGIEAVYWNKPSILASNSFYRNLGGTYNPKSHKELIRYLLSDIPPKDKISALKYGYYTATFGISYEHFDAEDYVNGKFKNTDIAYNSIFMKFIKQTKSRWIFNPIYILYNCYRLFGKNLFSIFKKIL